MKRLFPWPFALVLSAGLLFAACGSEDRSAREEAEEAAREMDEAAREMEEAAKELQESGAEGIAALGKALEGVGRALNEGSKIEPVNHRVLMELLPEELDGMERTYFESSSGGSPLADVSEAEARYQDDDRSLEISIVDPGSMTGLATLGFTWLNLEIDKESSNGFERTTKFRGYPAHQELRRSDGDRGDCKMSVYVGERFIVQADGRNMTMDELEDVVDSLDLDDLADMKDEGVEK